MWNPKPLETVTETEWLSLDEYVAANKDDSILYVRVRGESMLDVGIDSGDLVVIVLSQEPKENDIVFQSLNGKNLISHYQPKFRRNLRLVTDKPFEAVETWEIYGVVTFIIKKVN